MQYRPTNQFIQTWIKKFGNRPDEEILKKYLNEAYVITKGRYWDGVTIHLILYIPQINLIFICDHRNKKILKFSELKKFNEIYKPKKGEGHVI